MSPSLTLLPGGAADSRDNEKIEAGTSCREERCGSMTILWYNAGENLTLTIHKRAVAHGWDIQTGRRGWVIALEQILRTIPTLLQHHTDKAKTVLQCLWPTYDFLQTMECMIIQHRIDLSQLAYFRRIQNPHDGSTVATKDGSALKSRPKGT